MSDRLECISSCLFFLFSLLSPCLQVITLLLSRTDSCLACSIKCFRIIDFITLYSSCGLLLFFNFLGYLPIITTRHCKASKIMMDSFFALVWVVCSLFHNCELAHYGPLAFFDQRLYTSFLKREIRRPIIRLRLH